MPWYASLPRIESRFYIEQYGGENDVWIGKTLYRMPYVSNDLYLELAKADYNNCQALHRLEWNDILRWYSECSIGEHGVSQSCLLMAHFLAAATLFEPEQSKERLAWAKTIALLEAIDTQFLNDNVSFEDRRRFVNEFRNSYMHQGYVSDDRTNINRDKEGSKLVGLLMSTINLLSLDAFVRHGRDIRNQLCQAVHANGTSNEEKNMAKLDEDMQSLTKAVLSNNNGIDSWMKQTCLAIIRTSYYAAYCTLQEIDYHISKVLFQKVD
ncbi:hypothetical protein RND81_05G034300 [Saponaria officinalis]|uniref:Uncharacterized protein n=1 Tax=Saponaria officinalis TaxID=3572 RepID=A0AAW1KXC8_SAPOF